MAAKRASQRLEALLAEDDELGGIFLGRKEQPNPRSVAAAGKARAVRTKAGVLPRDSDANTAQALLDGLGEGLDPEASEDERAEEEARLRRRAEI